MTDKSKLGLVSVSFRGHTPREILEEMKKVGLSCIEWGSDVHAPYFLNLCQTERSQS